MRTEAKAWDESQLRPRFLLLLPTAVLCACGHCPGTDKVRTEVRRNGGTSLLLQRWRNCSSSCYVLQTKTQLVLKDIWILRVGLGMFLTCHLFNAFPYKTITQDCSPSKLVISKLCLIPVTYLVRITWNELKTSNVVWNLYVLAAAKPSLVFGHSPILSE